MSSTSWHSKSAAFRRALSALLAPVLLAASTITVSNDPRIGGGPDMGGGLPNASPAAPPSSPSAHSMGDIATPTVGLVLDAQTRQVVCGVWVVVTNSLGEPIASDVTDEFGRFVVCLKYEQGLELAIPSEGIAGIPVQAGEGLLVVIP